MLPTIIGHRGAALRAPENTVAGLRKAAELGCTWVEFDVRLTADDQLAMIHDPTVDRTTGATGRVRDLTLRALEALDAGTPFDPAFAGEAVPSLATVIAALDRLNLRANIEIKCDEGDAELAAKTLVAQLEAEWRAPEPPLISSFDHAALATVRQQHATLPIGVLVPTLEHDWQTAFDAVSAATLHVGNRDLLREQVAPLVAAGIEIGVFTVNDPARATELLSWGIAGVFSDCPDTIAAALIEN